MSRRSRLKPIDRKAAILKVAIKLFNQKGYQNTTMADLVEASGLSFGGFYHHYRHKADILLDIMRQGNQLRIKRSQQLVKKHNKLSCQDILIELTLNKLLDKNELKSIYAMLLLAMKKDPKLRCFYRQLEKEGIHGLKEFLQKNHFTAHHHITSEFVIGFINSLFLGMYVLNLSSIFMQEKKLLREVIKLLLFYQKGKVKDFNNEK